MTARLLLLSFVFLSFALPASATVKIYDSSIPNGIPGDVFQYTTTQCPPIQPSLGTLAGNHTLNDTGGGTVTIDTYLTTGLTKADYGPDVLTSVFGPGSFVFVDAETSNTFSPLGHTGTGSTAPSGSVAWGVISGWKNTGYVYCASSPQTICTLSTMVPHGVTSAQGPVDSPTYDLGTWSFDAEGDMLATSYITGTNMGGTSNRQSLLRGAYVGSSIPALPLIGAGALALGLAVAGTRSFMRKK
jgi:hypothetical protein